MNAFLKILQILLIGVLLCSGIYVLFIAFPYTTYLAWTRKSAWKSFAEENSLDLQTIDGELEINGTLKGENIRIRETDKSPPLLSFVLTFFPLLNYGQGVTLFTLSHHLDWPHGVELRTKHLTDKIARKFGEPDEITGNEEFDSSVVLESTSGTNTHPDLTSRNKEQIQNFLTPKRVQVLQTFFQEHPGDKLTENELQIAVRGYVNSTDEMERTVNALQTVLNNLRTAKKDEKDHTSS